MLDMIIYPSSFARYHLILHGTKHGQSVRVELVLDKVSHDKVVGGSEAVEPTL